MDWEYRTVVVPHDKLEAELKASLVAGAELGAVVAMVNGQYLIVYKRPRRKRAAKAAK